MADKEDFYTPVPAGTSKSFSPPEALREIAELVDPKYRMYFLSGTRQLMEGEFVSAEDRVLIASLRDEILSGGDVERVFDNINRFLTTGETFQLARGQVSAVLSGTRYVSPTEDPLGRTGEETGFGRDGGDIPTGTAQELATGAEDIEPGELARPSMGGAPGVITADEQVLRDLLVPGASDRINQETLEQFYGDTNTTTTTEDGGGGVASDVSAAPTALDQAIPEDWRDAAREAYPSYYAIVRNIPEIAELLEDAIAEGFTEQEFQARLEQTNWWKQTTASAREWDINGERDPASQQTQIDNRVALIRQVALDSFGVRLGADSLNELANDSLRLGWTQQFLLNAIGDVATQSTAGVSQLRAGYIGQQLRQTANDYGIAISDNTFNKFVNQIAVGQETQDTFQQYALTQAKNLFPSVSDRLDAGETFQQIVDPYREQAARLLEIDPDEIDFTQSEYVKALTYQDERGEQRPMSFTEFGDYIRQTRSFGYEYTDQARNKAYQVANDLANLFGKA